MSISPSNTLSLEIQTLLSKNAIEPVSPKDQGVDYYFRYFTLPKRDGRLKPILDCVQEVPDGLPVQHPDTPSSGDMDGPIIPQRCIVPSHDLTQTLEFPEVCNWKSTLSLYGPPLQDLYCPVGLHKGDDGDCGPSQIFWNYHFSL